jgi:hypothetical protein
MTLNYLMQQNDISILPVDIVNLKIVVIHIIVDLFQSEEEKAKTLSDY